MTINESLKSITIFLPNQEIFKAHLGKTIGERTVKEIDAFLENSGVRITYTNGSYELFSGNPFIFNQPFVKSDIPF